MHSATETICGIVSCKTLIIARSLRLSALGSVINAKSSSVSFSSLARNWNRFDTDGAFHNSGGKVSAFPLEDHYTLYCLTTEICSLFLMKESYMYYICENVLLSSKAAGASPFTLT